MQTSAVAGGAGRFREEIYRGVIRALIRPSPAAGSWPRCQWRSKKGPLGGCGRVAVVHGRDLWPRRIRPTLFGLVAESQGNLSRFERIQGGFPNSRFWKIPDFSCRRLLPVLAYTRTRWPHTNVDRFRTIGRHMSRFLAFMPRQLSNRDTTETTGLLNVSRVGPSQAIVVVDGVTTKALGDRVGTVAKFRLLGRPIGTVPAADMAAVDRVLRVHLAL